MTDETDATTENEEEPWPRWANLFLEAFKRIPSVADSARAAGVSRVTVWRLQQRDERFALAVDGARNEALDVLERLIYQRGTVGQPVRKTVTRTLANGTVETTVTEEANVSSIDGMFYLKRWRPEYRESFRVESTGPGGGPLKHEVTVVEEVAAEARAELERLGAS